jgi:hypothetical protein
MMLALFIILLITGLCVAHWVSYKIPHRPAPKEIKHVRHVLAEDAWSGLFKMVDDTPGPDWKPERWLWSKEDYEKMRAKKTSDWTLP